MSMTRRDRRDWRIVLWVVVVSTAISAVFGYVIPPQDVSRPIAMLVSMAAALVIATPLVIVETRSERIEGLRRLRRLPLSAFFAIKVTLYSIVIVGGLLLVRYVVLATIGLPPGIDATFRTSLFFAIGMSVGANLFFEFGGLLGFGTLRSLVTGRYVQPRREQRTFLLIDMKNSTGLAERLGPVRFHELLNDFFRNIAEAALECRAEIHKYVGDEAILTWTDDQALADGEALECPFIVRDLIASQREQYRRRYDAVPDFRAALHCGEIVAGEIGDLRREIAYVGDTLNVAARLLEAAKEIGHDVLVSDDLLKRTKLPEGVRSIDLPVLSVRNRETPLSIWALSRTADAA
ncbi:MAG TPA: adenylate/guanylate cyclase domain-containing protein [Reyranella sp.]|nr:adenylate/guanylate cyclase domain-containing protein [Reyranella sp.]